MGNPEVSSESGAGVTPPLSPEQFVNDMDELASYLAGRGLPMLIMGHYAWLTRYLAAYFNDSPEALMVTIGIPVPVPLPGISSARIKFTFRPEQDSLLPPVLIFIIAALQSLGRLWQLIVTLIERLAASALLSARDYSRANAGASAPLIAGIVIVFFAGDSWKILGQGFDWQFWALLGFFLGFSVLGLADLYHLRSHVHAAQTDIEAGSGAPAERSLSAALAAIGYEQPIESKISTLGMINVSLVYFGIITANLFLIGSLVAGALTVIGIVRINVPLTRQLSGGEVHVLVHLPGGMVITQELLSLAFSLGGLAVLSFTFLTLTNQQARGAFTARAMTGLRRVLISFAVYSAAQESEAELTGVTSRRTTRDELPDVQLWGRK
jgi:hypothetical protein